MIHSKKTKIAILFLTLILLINYIVVPKKANAEVLTGSLVALYGPVLAEKLLAFILLAASAGVTFNAVEEAKAMFDKWQMDSNNWEPPLKPGGSGNGWRDALKDMLIGGAVGGAIYEVINKIKDFFKSFGAKVGENIYYDNIPHIEKVGNNTFDITVNGTSGGVETNDFWVYGYINYEDYISESGYKNTRTILTAHFSNGYSQTKKWDYKSTTIRFLSTGGSVQVIAGTSISQRLSDLLDKNSELPKSKQIIYNVTNNSYVITNVPPATTLQPNITNIPNIKQVITPDGKVKQVYEGNTDDLIDDMLESTPADDLTNLVSNSSYTIYEIDTETGTIIEIETGEDELPFPDLQNPETPENELQGQGIIITLLKSIVNWLYNIWRLPQTLLTKLFEVPDDLTLDTSKLRLRDYQLKFPFSIPWDLYKSIKVFAQTPSEPELGIDINTDYLNINHKINLESIQIPLRFARYVATIFFIIFLANKTRDLIKW